MYSKTAIKANCVDKLYLSKIPDRTICVEYWYFIEVSSHSYIGHWLGKEPRNLNFPDNCEILPQVFVVMSKNMLLKLYKALPSFLRTKWSRYETLCLLLFLFLGSKNCNVVLLDASTANIGSNSLAPAASIFTLSTYMGIVIANSVFFRKILNFYINFLLLTENWDSIDGNETTPDWIRK